MTAGELRRLLALEDPNMRVVVEPGGGHCYEVVGGRIEVLFNRKPGEWASKFWSDEGDAPEECIVLGNRGYDE